MVDPYLNKTMCWLWVNTPSSMVCRLHFTLRIYHTCQKMLNRILALYFNIKINTDKHEGPFKTNCPQALSVDINANVSTLSFSTGSDEYVKCSEDLVLNESVPFCLSPPLRACSY